MMVAPLIPNLQRFAYGCTKDHDSAADVLQDSLIRAWENIDKFEMGTNLQGWIKRIIVRLHLNSTRLLHHRYLRSYDQEPGLLKLAHSPARGFEEDFGDECCLALRKLTPELRSTLIVTELDGMPDYEYAHALGLSEATMRGRRLRVRQRMQSCQTFVEFAASQGYKATGQRKHNKTNKERNRGYDNPLVTSRKLRRAA